MQFLPILVILWFADKALPIYMKHQARRTLFSFNKHKAKNHEKIGVSLQSDGVAFARINTDTQPPQLLDCAFESVNDNESIQLSLQTILKQHRLTDSEVVLVLDKADFTFQTMESPQVETSEKVQAIRWKLKDVIDFDVSDAIVDILTCLNPAVVVVSRWCTL